MTQKQENIHFSMLTNKPLDYRNESGIGYVMILFILVLLSSLSLAFIAKVGTEISVIMNRGNGMQAEYLAESAANHALWRLLNEVNVTRDIRVSNNDDDAAEEYSGVMHVNDDRMDLGKWQYGGVRFLNVNIPQDSTITNAYIDVTARHSHSEDTDITIRCEDTDDATTFTSSVNDISSRIETSASVTWNSIPGWTEGSVYQTPDLSSIIQEVVDRPGWSSGNSIVILFELTDPGGKRCIKSHDSSSADAALLHIEYSGTDLPASNVYTMHSLAGGRYGYKIRSHTDTTFATIATVGAIGNQVVKQGYVVYVKPGSLPVVSACPKNLLYVVGDSLNLTTKETTRKTLMEGWNANVTLLSDSASESEYDAGIAANDVVYCSPSAVGASILDKLTGKDIGIVNEVLGKLDDFGFCRNYMSTSVDTFTASDPAHYITSPFDGDDINFFTLSLSTTGLGGTLAPDLHNLGEVSGVPSMAALSTGDQRYDGDPAPNRRVFLPFTNAETDQITTDGQYLMMRAIEWAAHMDTGCSTGTSLLFVVKDAGSLTTQETARKTLMESWGFAVTLIDDDDTQASFDSAAAANSAAYISQEALATSVGTKLTSKTIGVVNENKDMVDDLGFVTGLSIGGGLPTMNVDSSHYITSVFATNPVSMYAATEWYMIYDIPVATGVYQLGKWAESPWADRPALMTLCQGDSLIGGGTAVGRRVQLPWGSGQGDTPVDINNSLTDDGRTVTKRAIEWAAGSGVCPNMPPTVDAGLDQDLTFPTVKTSLDGTVTDDNLPDPPDTVTTTWSQVSGPAGVTFDDDSQVDTVVKFPGLGTYVLRLTADDSALTVFDELTVEVAGVAFENFSETSNSSKGVVIDIDKPSGTAVGDLLIAAVAIDGDTESALSPPSGWTEIRKGQSHGAVTFGVWWKIASGGDPIAFQFDWTGDDPFRSYGWIMRFTGHDSGSPIATSNKLTGSSNKPPSGNLTTDADGMLILRLGGFDDDDITLGSPGLSGHTAITMNRSNKGKGTVSGGAGYIIQATAGDTGTSSFSLKRSEEYCTVTVAIRPEP